MDLSITSLCVFSVPESSIYIGWIGVIGVLRLQFVVASAEVYHCGYFPQDRSAQNCESMYAHKLPWSQYEARTITLGEASASLHMQQPVVQSGDHRIGCDASRCQGDRCQSVQAS